MPETGSAGDTNGTEFSQSGMLPVSKFDHAW